MIKVVGHSMINEGICKAGTLIVNCSIEPVNGKIVIAIIDG